MNYVKYFSLNHGHFQNFGLVRESTLTAIAGTINVQNSFPLKTFNFIIYKYHIREPTFQHAKNKSAKKNSRAYKNFTADNNSPLLCRRGGIQ